MSTSFLILATPVLDSPSNMTASKRRGLVPREVLFGNPERTSPKLSPDGRFLSYLAPNANNVLNVFVKKIDEPAGSAVAVTNDKKVSAKIMIAHSGYLHEQQLYC